MNSSTTSAEAPEPKENSKNREPDDDNDRGESSKKKMKPNYYRECFPITSLDSIAEILENPPYWAKRVLPLRHRSTTVVQNTVSDCHVELRKFAPKARLDRRFIPKTLVCHDYKGGYLEDKYLSSSALGNRYTFYNWAHIDIFVYFSHNLITIPPLCWINAAHKNGVKILGTLITEFDPGTKTCEKIFRDEDTMRIFATSLTQIAKTFNFDGWLLNIENPLPDAEMLKKFVAYLTQSVHKDNPDNIVIWYDSVIETGQLKWQNELNKTNQCFFDSCDGIFLNYVWTEEHLKRTVELAKHRTLDVFVGVDVFGRNTFGGGQFNCFKAAQVIRRHNLSMAVFAPGWTHETVTEREGQQKFFEDFVNKDSAFWNSLWPYLYTHPINDFFRTSFFIGANQAVYNIFAQQHQLSRIKHPEDFTVVPDYLNVPTLANKCNCCQCAFGEKGVRCLITKQFLNTSICYVHRLFTCDLALAGNVTVHFLTKNNDNLALITLHLLTVDKTGSFRKIKCNSVSKSETVDNATVMEINPSSDVTLINYVYEHYEALLLQENLSVFVYNFSVPPCTLLEMGCVLDEGNSVYFCAFGIERRLP